MRVDIRVPVGKPLPELAGFIRRCEEAGFHGVGIHDHHHSGRDAYVALALAASSTERVLLYPATSNPVTRHPVILAALANSLHEIAPRRTQLTVAPGYLAVENVGWRKASRSDLGAAIASIRRLLRGDAVEFAGRSVRLRNHPISPLPVLVLASGPRMIELAGEVADGVAMLVGLHPSSVAAAREHLATGARKAGRDPAALTELFITPIAIAEPEIARQWPRRLFRPDQRWLTYPSDSNLRWLRSAGIELADDFDPPTLSDAESDRICDAFGCFGPPEHCAERLLRAQEEAGIEHVFLFPAHSAETSYELPVAEVKAFEGVLGARIGI